MAVFKSLTFDGINSLNYGIYITGEAVYNAPERAVEMVTIPGRNGALAIDQGYFENIEVSYPCGCFAETQADFAEKVSAFRNAIASRYSYKRLTDEYNTDEYRLGLYKSGLEVSAVRYGTAGQFTITFDCKPQRFLLDGDAELSPTDYSDVHTASGDIVQIENDGSLGVKSLTASLEPIQDLNGYDKPWSGGNGKNKLPLRKKGYSTTLDGITYTFNEDGSLTLNGTATATTSLTLTSAEAEQNKLYLTAGTYIVSGEDVADSNFYIGINVNSTSGGYTTTTKSGNHQFTLAEGDYAFPRVRVPQGLQLTNKKIYPMIRFASETDATYEPYSNICPISGHTECETSVSGVNVWDEEWERAVINWTTFKFTPSATGGRLASKNYIRVEPNWVYYAHFDTANTVLCGYSDNEGNNGRSIAVNSSNHLFTVPSDCHYLKFGVNTSSYGTVYNHDISINYPSTDHEYHAYEGHQYTTSLGRTVYGGTLDVVSGVLTVDRATGSVTTVDAGSTVTTGKSRWSTQLISNIDALGILLSDKYEQVTNAQTYSNIQGVSVHPTNGKLYIYDEQLATMSTAEVNAYLASNPIQIVYELSTPQTYQLTAQGVELLLGTNNLWTDCGDNTVEYGIPPYYNPTEFDAKPLIKVTGRGTLGIGEYILTITGTVTQTLYIDCETMEIYTLEGTVPTGASSLVSINKTDFPVLKSGHNGVSVGSGLSALKITPRWWRV